MLYCYSWQFFVINSSQIRLLCTSWHSSYLGYPPKRVNPKVRDGVAKWELTIELTIVCPTPHAFHIGYITKL